MNIDNSFIISLVWLFLYALGIIAAVVVILGGIAFWKTGQGSAKTFSLLLQRGNALRLLTVVMIVAVVTLLTLVGKIEGAAALGILSGIGGYVLGGLEKVKAEYADDKPRGEKKAEISNKESLGGLITEGNAAGTPSRN